MKFDFYLSEMSVSNQHGGGLTLQKVIGDELEHISCFAHVNRFAYDLPANSKFSEKGLDLTSIWESDSIRKFTGRSLAFNISRKLNVVKSAAKRAAKRLDKQFERSRAVSGLICPQGLNSIYTLEALKAFRKVTYVSWVMDDHLVRYVNGEWQYPADVESVYRKHLREAAHVFVISQVMQEFYQKRFGIKSTVLFGPCDFEGKVDDANIKPHKLFKIGYFGAVAAWQLDVLTKVANALDANETELNIYSNVKQLPSQLQKQGVNLLGQLNPADVLSTMQGYDAVLLPISFLNVLRNMSEFNIATKMSEYLASGVPILAVGPGYSAMIDYLKDNNVAVVVESEEKEAIQNALHMLRDKKLVDQLLVNAQAVVFNETGVSAMKKRWSDVLDSLPLG
ncbi:MAG: hypothetical protein ACXVJE_13470 [Mucilaginibacter sp.]